MTANIILWTSLVLLGGALWALVCDIRHPEDQRKCFHHAHYRPTHGREAGHESWLRSEMIDLGRHKLFWCTHCQQQWIV